MDSAARTPPPSYPALTGLRGCAALWVLIYHAWVEAEPRLMLLPLGFTDLNLTPWFSIGWFGVDIFFCLSAFLLTLPFAAAQRLGEPQPRLRDYFRRRVLRILPAYYLQLALVLGFVFLVDGRFGISLSALAAHAVLWLNLGPDPVPPLVGVWWTLPIEFGYYLLLPLLVPLLRPRRLIWLVPLALILTFAYRYGMFLHAADRSVGDKVLLLEQLPGRFDQFVLGSVAAVLVSRLDRFGTALAPAAARSLTLGGIALVALLIAMINRMFMQYWEGHWLLYSFHGLASIAIAAFIIGACSDRVRDWRILASTPLLFAGTISYSLYLWHQLILQWLSKQAWITVVSPYKLPALLLVGGALAVTVAWLSWRFVEAPCLAWGRSAYDGSDQRTHGGGR